jgi:hypothetical protein
MDRIVHHASPGAIGQPYPAVSGNTYSSRPTRYEPMACDCCNKLASRLDLQRSTSRFEFGELPSYVCYACASAYPEGEPRELRIRWIVTRAGRFGQQWQDAVRAQLGWPV